MQKVFYVVLILVSFSTELKSQDFKDWIVDFNSDTIDCNITLINEQNIFYEFLEKKKIKSDYISRKSIIDYSSSTTKEIKKRHSLEKVIFYGYDFERFKMRDVKRINQNIQGFLNIWIDYMNENIDAYELRRLLEVDVIFNQNGINELNNELNSFNLVTQNKYTLSRDSIPFIIKNLPVNSSKKEIGLVVVYECFSDIDETVSAYYVLFDTQTREILQINYSASHLHLSYNRVIHWAYAMRQGLSEFAKEFEFN